MITYINGVDWMACQKDKNRQISIFFIEINSAIHQIHQLFTKITFYDYDYSIRNIHGFYTHVFLSKIFQA